MSNLPQTLNYKIIGTAPLLTHNGQLADPLNPFAKEMKKISGKRAKVEADFEQLARLEWRGSLYMSEGRPALPGEMIEATIVGGAKKQRKGKVARAAVFCDHPVFLDYDGPKDPDEMWADPKYRYTCGVRVQQSRVMRTRPIFRKWSAKVELAVLDEEVEADDVTRFFADAGRYVGLGDYRPKFGRFRVERVA
ncbi:MAG: hypothetical protein AAGA25_17755 [Planctomycetota bacterium]